MVCVAGSATQTGGGVRSARDRVKMQRMNKSPHPVAHRALRDARSTLPLQERAQEDAAAGRSVRDGPKSAGYHSIEDDATEK